MIYNVQRVQALLVIRQPPVRRRSLTIPLPKTFSYWYKTWCIQNVQRVQALPVIHQPVIRVNPAPSPPSDSLPLTKFFLGLLQFPSLYQLFPSSTSLPSGCTCLSKEREERTHVRVVEACNLESENLKLVSAKLGKDKKQQKQKTGEISKK